MTVRVLHVAEAIEAGVARHVSDVVAHVDAEHHVVVPPARVGGFTDERALARMREAGAELHLTDMRRFPLNPRNVAAMRTVRALTGSVAPDVVHGHASIGGAVARVGAAGTRAKRVYTPHGLLPRRGAMAVERGLGRLTDRFVAVSASEAELAARLRLAPASRIEVIPNGIELDPPEDPAPDLRERLGAAGSTPLIGCVGRLAPQKAPDVFVAACALIARDSDARFVLIGEGPLRAEVAAAVRAAGIEDRFLLLPGLENAAAAMPQLSVFALPSRYEAGPYTPLEAMRAGVPVVLTDVVGNRDTVRDGDNGLLVPPESPEALADAVRRLLDDRGLAVRFTDAAREDLAERFDVSVMARRIERLYGELAGA